MRRSASSGGLPVKQQVAIGDRLSFDWTWLRD